MSKLNIDFFKEITSCSEKSGPLAICIGESFQDHTVTSRLSMHFFAEMGKIGRADV